MAIKVFDLSCEHDHLFEGWFSSLDTYDDQLSRGMVRCPVCQSAQITRRVSAPHLNVSHLKAEPQVAKGQGSGSATVLAPSSSQLATLQAEMLRQIREIVRNTDNVGTQFADEARRMHEGEIEQRAIRGTATASECQSLLDDGISIMPIPDILDDDRLQ
ncbi:DUF1178 family protein [Alcaligenaceae bacterium CGII-47]|nr:DUF1178 family protein [Alcaligenaceae bacterium CGII-47]